MNRQIGRNKTSKRFTGRQVIFKCIFVANHNANTVVVGAGWCRCPHFHADLSENSESWYGQGRQRRILVFSPLLVATCFRPVNIDPVATQ